MKLRAILLLLFAVGAAGLTAMVAQTWLAAQRAAITSDAPAQNVVEAVPATEVLVATKDLAVGTFIRADDLRWQPWPEAAVTEEYTVKGKGKEDDFEGAVVRSRLVAGEPVTRSRVVQPGERGFLAAVLEPGTRAVSVPIDATSGIAGFVFPGDSVDVLLTFRTSVKDVENNESETRFFSETLLEGVRVLAIDQQVDNETGTAKVAKTATLEVTPKEAERIAIALQIGSLSLSLRSLAIGDGDALVVAETGADDVDVPVGGSYTRDVDVYYMLGAPYGLPFPSGGEGQGVDVLRGSAAERVRF